MSKHTSNKLKNKGYKSNNFLNQQNLQQTSNIVGAYLHNSKIQAEQVMKEMNLPEAFHLFLKADPSCLGKFTEEENRNLLFLVLKAKVFVSNCELENNKNI